MADSVLILVPARLVVVSKLNIFFFVLDSPFDYSVALFTYFPDLRVSLLGVTLFLYC